ncbi:arylsulfatase, partial [bacterium]
MTALAVVGLTSLGSVSRAQQAAPPVTNLPNPQAPRPNVLLILADDLGYADLGCYGSEIKTPNIDALAATGLRFTQCYNSARCSPSRASLLTGLAPHQAGFPNLAGVLSPRSVTLPEMLHDAGYSTSMV